MGKQAIRPNRAVVLLHTRVAWPRFWSLSDRRCGQGNPFTVHKLVAAGGVARIAPIRTSATGGGSH